MPKIRPEEITLRDGTSDDLPFIYATWLRSQRKQGDNSQIRNRTYFEQKAIEIRRLISSAQVIVASSPEDQAQIFGYLVGSSLKSLQVIHYVYVKTAFRKLGIATNMATHFSGPSFMKEEVGITSMGPVIATIKDRYRLVFNPYLVEIMEELQR